VIHEIPIRIGSVLSAHETQITTGFHALYDDEVKTANFIPDNLLIGEKDWKVIRDPFKFARTYTDFHESHEYRLFLESLCGAWDFASLMASS
jgi:hypothetical protein